MEYGRLVKGLAAMIIGIMLINRSSRSNKEEQTIVTYTDSNSEAKSEAIKAVMESDCTDYVKKQMVENICNGL